MNDDPQQKMSTRSTVRHATLHFFFLFFFLAAPLPVLVVTASAVEPYEVEVGLWTCPRGYQIRPDGTCKSDAEIPHGPVVEVSELPSAGEGAPSSCPRGGCDSFVPPFYWWLIASATAELDQGGWRFPRWYEGWSSGGLRGGDLGLGVLAPPVLSPGGFSSAARHRRHSFSERGSRSRFTGARFLGGSPSHGAVRRGGRWR